MTLNDFEGHLAVVRPTDEMSGTLQHFAWFQLPKHSVYSESACCAAPGVRRRNAQGTSSSVLPDAGPKGSSRSMDVAVAVWHHFARYSTTGQFAQLFPPFDSLS